MAHEYEQVVAARHDAGAAHIATMPAPPDVLVRWVALMARRYGETIAVGNAGTIHQTDKGPADLTAFKKGWLEALLIIKHGEAPEHWPATWTDELVARADQWARGRTPSGITYPTTD